MPDNLLTLFVSALDFDKNYGPKIKAALQTNDITQAEWLWKSFLEAYGLTGIEQFPWIKKGLQECREANARRSRTK
jgi:hypothetical protein